MVYVYQRDASSFSDGQQWSLVETWSAGDPRENAGFGTSVALSGDLAVVGSFAGADWSPSSSLVHWTIVEEDGWSYGDTWDGTYGWVTVHAPGPNGWTLESTLRPENSAVLFFGRDVATSNGRIVLSSYSKRPGTTTPAGTIHTYLRNRNASPR